MKYCVKRYWQACDSVTVDANCVDEAIRIAHERPFDVTNSQCIPDSLNTDPDADVYPLVEAET